MRRGREARAKRLLQGISVPDEFGAQERAWAVARSAFLGRLSVPRRRSRLRFVPVPALLLGVAVILELTPAGAAVHHLINNAFSARTPVASNALSLPVRGSRVLVTSPSGTWIVKDRGARHRLGQWDVAAWSPHGLYVAAADAHTLATLTPSGAVAWSAPAAGARYLSWFEPQGSRQLPDQLHQRELALGDDWRRSAQGSGFRVPPRGAWPPTSRQSPRLGDRVIGTSWYTQRRSGGSFQSTTQAGSFGRRGPYRAHPGARLLPRRALACSH